MPTIGLDFGTTNSSISFFEKGKPELIPIDLTAPDPSVVRSALYFFPRQIVISPDVPPKRALKHEYYLDEVSYIGEEKKLIGTKAIEQYMHDNRFRKPAITRTYLTGKTIHIIFSFDPRVETDAPEQWVEVDYGMGRLFHALKSALKAENYHGSTVFGKFYSLESLISQFLSQMKISAEKYLQTQIPSVVCGRPVFFSTNPAKDQAAQGRLKDALTEAGFKDVKFEYEPVAAARAYLLRVTQPGKKILVFDFGGGTLDVTVMESGNPPKILANDGVYIGGNLLNTRVFSEKIAPYFGSKIRWGDLQLPFPNYIFESLESWYSIANLNTPEQLLILEGYRYKCSDTPALNRLVHLISTNLGFELYEAIEKAKIRLTSEISTHITYKDGPIDLNIPITRPEFESIIAPQLQEVEKTVLNCLKNAKTDPQEITTVVRTGGSSLIPKVEEMLYDLFGKNKVELFDTFTSIAAGLAINQ